MHTPGRAFAAVRLVWPVGWVAEPSGREGVATLAARMLNAGTRRLDADAFALETERTGAVVTATAGPDAFTLAVDALPERISEALDLALEALEQPRLNEAGFQRFRGQVLDVRRQRVADPSLRADEELRATIFSGGRLGVPASGTAESLGALTLEDVAGFYGRYLDRTSATVIVASDEGRLDPRAVAEPALEGAPGGDRAVTASPSIIAPVLDPPEPIVVDRPGATQSFLAIGHAGPPRSTPDFAALRLASVVLGATFGSRLNLQLREVRGFTYGARAGFAHTATAGTFACRSAVAADATAAALADVRAVLVRVLRDGVEPEEIDRARSYLLGREAPRFETARSTADALAGLVAVGLPLEHLGRLHEELPGLGPADVERALQRHLHLDRLATVVVCDARRVLPFLERVDPERRERVAWS